MLAQFKVPLMLNEKILCLELKDDNIENRDNDQDKSLTTFRNCETLNFNES